MLPSFAGAVAPDWIRRFVAEGGGGVMLFATNVPSRVELASLCASLRAESADLLFAIDEEGGDVTRLEWRTGSSYPGGAALGVIDDIAVTEAVAAAIAAELGSVGVNWNLAPVADVNVPENPVIGARAFGDDAATVARHVAAFVRGTQAAASPRARSTSPATVPPRRTRISSCRRSKAMSRRASSRSAQLSPPGSARS